MFHRLVTPTYFGGLPAGYDHINDPVANGFGASSPAGFDGQKSTGSNEGTYFASTTEPANSTNQNRPNQALAENCDVIDDIIRTSVPTPTFAPTPITTYTAGGGGDTERALAGLDVFVGRSGVTVNQAERDRLLQVVDANSLQPIIVAGSPIFVNDIRDSGDSGNVIGTEATGFHTAPIAVFSATITAAVNYRILYLTRGTVTGESDATDATGDMGYLAQLIIQAANRIQVSANLVFTPGLSTWKDGSSLVAVTGQAAIDEVVDTLGSQLASNGAGKVGVNEYIGTSITLSAGSVEDQLEEIADGLAGLAANNIFTGTSDFQANIVGALFSSSATTNTFLGTTFNATAATLNLGSGSGNIGLDGAVQIDGTLFANVDSIIHVGRSNTANAYQNRFGRVHASWSHFREDFNVGATPGQYPQWTFSAGTIVDNNTDGRVVLGPTGTSIGNNELLEAQGTTYGGPGGPRAIVFEAIFLINVTLANVIFTAGITSQQGVNPDAGGDGCWVRFDTDLGDSNWVLVGSNGGVITTSASSVAPILDTWVRATLEIGQDGSAELFINGVSEATIAAGSVDVSTSLMGPQFYLETRAASSRTARVDKVELWQEPVI